MRECETLRDDLKAYLDGELSPMARMAIRLHLMRCASCRKEIHTMEQIGNELRAGDAGGLDVALRAKLVAGIPDASAGAPERPAPLPKWKRKPVIIWGATAAAMLIWFAYQTTSHLATGGLPFGSIATSNAKQLGIGILQYTQDYDERFASNAPAPPGASAGQVMAKGEMQLKAPIQQRVEAMKSQMMMEHMGAAPKMMVPSERSRTSSDTAAGETPSARMVHREASINVEVAKLEPASDAVEDMVKATGGYVAKNELTTGDDDTKSASLTTKVPVAQFDSFLAKVAKMGNVTAKNVTGEDITEQVSDQAHAKRSLRDQIQDAEARLQAARSRSERRDEAENIRDLKVQVAQTQGRLELLNKMAALATITVDLHEKPKPPVVKTTGFVDEIGATGQAAVQSFLQAARLPFLMLIWLVAYAPIWLLLGLAYKYIIRT